MTFDVNCAPIGFTDLSFEFETQDPTGINTGTALNNGVPEQGFTMILQVVDDRWEVSLQGDPVRWLFTTDANFVEDPCNATWAIDTGGLIRDCFNPDDDPNDPTSIPNVTCTGGPPEEICDGIDNDGDGDIDEDLDFTTYYKDNDGDGFGDENISISTCDGAPSGFVEDNTDCDDLEFDVNPGAPEICDGLDNNCDGQIDENIPDCNNGVILEYCNDAKTKILVCHNGKDICVSINALPAHEAHGDFLGSCTNARIGETDIVQEDSTSYGVVSWPNPTRDSFNIRMSTPNTTDKVSLKAFDINGRLIHSSIINGNQDYQFGCQLNSGIYFVRLSQADKTKVVKIIKQ